jgi:hypothetical protein
MRRPMHPKRGCRTIGRRRRRRRIMQGEEIKYSNVVGIFTACVDVLNT